MKPYAIQSIRALHEILDLPKPEHPLISVIDYTKIKCYDDPHLELVTYGFYLTAGSFRSNGFAAGRKTKYFQ